MIVEQGRRCRRSGIGTPPICGGHRQAIGTAGPIAQLFESLMRGQIPARDTLEQATRQTIESLLGRALTPDEMHRARTVLDDAPSSRSGRSASSQGSASDSASRASAARAQQKAQEAEQIARARAIGRARKTLGFTAKEPLSKEVVKARQKALARKHHPDRGGSLERMQQINAAVDVLLQSP